MKCKICKKCDTVHSAICHGCARLHKKKKKPKKNVCPRCNGTGYELKKRIQKSCLWIPPNKKVLSVQCYRCGGKAEVSGSPTKEKFPISAHKTAPARKTKPPKKGWKKKKTSSGKGHQKMSILRREQQHQHPKKISVSPAKKSIHAFSLPTNNTTRPVTFNPYVPVSELYSGTDVPTLISPPSMEQMLSAGGNHTSTGTESVILPLSMNSLHHYQQQQRAAMPVSSYPKVAQLPSFLTQAATTEDIYNAQVAYFSHMYSKAQATYYPLQPSLPHHQVSSPAAVGLSHENQYAFPTFTPPENGQVEHPTMSHRGTDIYRTSEGIEYTHVIHPHLGPILDISNFVISS